MNKTIHVSAIVLAILILTVGCQGKKGGSRAEDEGSNSVKSAVILLIRSMAVDVALI